MYIFEVSHGGGYQSLLLVYKQCICNTVEMKSTVAVPIYTNQEINIFVLFVYSNIPWKWKWLRNISALLLLSVACHTVGNTSWDCHAGGAGIVFRQRVSHRDHGSPSNGTTWVVNSTAFVVSADCRWDGFLSWLHVCLRKAKYWHVVLG